MNITKSLQLIDIIRSSITVLCMLLSFCAYAQNADEERVSIHVKDNILPMKRGNIYSSTIKITNKGSDNFVGVVSIDTPKGLNPISDININVAIPAFDSIFVPIRFVSDATLVHGVNTVIFTLYDINKNIIDSSKTSLAVEQRMDLSLLVDKQNVLITNAADSVRMYATVINKGNRIEDVTVVFSIPTMQKGVNFVEQKHRIKPQSQHQFYISFIPHRDLMSQHHFDVNVAAMQGVEKNLFGGTTVTFQNVSDNKVYDDPTSQYGLYDYNSSNTLSVSHRESNIGSGITQLYGTTDIDLASGYLNLKGNMYKYGSSDLITATNTSLSYMQGNNEYMVGNIYESLETSLSGRGAKVKLGAPQSNIVIGLVDQEYNLFSDKAWFGDAYSMFAKIEYDNSNKNLRRSEASILYQRSDRYMSNDVIAGGELNWMLKNIWSVSLRLHGALSHYETDKKDKITGSAELLYSGEARGYNLSGNYYLSSNYFPGNRRGVLSIQQSIAKKIGKYSLHTNGYYYKFSPRSHAFRLNTTSSNFMGNAEIYFPKLFNVTLGVGYQNQYEFTNNYIQSHDGATDIDMRANRVKAMLIWNGSKFSQSIHMSTEVGLYNFQESTNKGQQKYNLSYSNKWFTLMSQYQRGSYYISEQISSKGSNRPFERMITSLSLHNNMLDDKLSVMVTANINKDYYSDFSPSVYLNARYSVSQRLSVFVNSYWNNYKYRNTTSVNSYSNEVGLSVYFNKSNVSSSKKSKVKAFVYHDYNSNGKYDNDDKPAIEYPVLINKEPFITNNKGEVTYRKVPYGTYEIGHISKEGWYGDADSVEVKRIATAVEIPLKKAGVVQGRVLYDFDSKTSMYTEPKMDGIVFQVTSADGSYKKRVSTNSDGEYTLFLPTDEYKIELILTSLPTNTNCVESTRLVTVESNKIVKLSPFEIEVNQKKVNVRRF